MQESGLDFPPTRGLKSSNSVNGTALRRLSVAAAAHSSEVAVSTPSQDGRARSSISFADLEERSNRLAHHLRTLNISQGSCVALLLDRSIDFVVAALAVMKSGAAYLPLDASTPSERINFILDNADARRLITHRSKGRTTTIAAEVTVIDLDDRVTIGAIGNESAEPLDQLPTANDLAYVIYTSGSSGQPKGVEITHGNLLSLIDWHVKAFDVSSADRASQVAGLGFDAAVWEIWPALCAGATVLFADEATRRSAPALKEWIIAQKITIGFVPTILAEQLLHGSWPAETALRTMLTGADTLHRRPIDGLPFQLVNNYGPSECTVVATSGLVTPSVDESGAPSIGRPIDHATVFLLDENLHRVAAGQPGELCIAGPLVGRGYRNNPLLTESRFTSFTDSNGSTHRIYRTGDRARTLANGEIAFLGRLDDQVKIRGYRVELGEIISALDRCPGVDASAVIARPAMANDPSAGLELVAYLVASPNASLRAGDLRTFLAARLPDYMTPEKFVRLKQLPMTANGKLDRAALPAPSASNLLDDNDGTTMKPAAAGGTLDARIAAIVAGLLGKSTIGISENFFMAGGHSMFGVQLVAKIRESFGVKLTLRQLFGAPTVSALSTEVEKLGISN